MSMGGIEDYGSHFSACAYLYPGLVWVLGLFVWVDECVGSPGSAQSFGYKLILGAWRLVLGYSVGMYGYSPCIGPVPEYWYLTQGIWYLVCECMGRLLRL